MVTSARFTHVFSLNAEQEETAQKVRAKTSLSWTALILKGVEVYARELESQKRGKNV